MADWRFAESHPTDELTQLSFFSMKKHQGDQTIEFRITVREFVERNRLSMRYYAEADKQTNQKTLPFTPCGWGDTLLTALGECVRSVHLFPYEGS